MTAVDTSVVVAAFASWHEGHAAATAALARGPRIPAHVLMEVFSVLTRMPPPHRAPAALVAEFLAERFPDLPLSLPARRYGELLGSFVAAGVSGGSAYDGLIGVTAREAGAVLLTRDMRAAAVYDRMHVRFELVT